MLRYAILYYHECYLILKAAGFNYKQDVHDNYMKQFDYVYEHLAVDTTPMYTLYMPSAYRAMLFECADDDDCIRYASTMEAWILAYKYYYAMDKTTLDNRAFAYTLNKVPEWLPQLMVRVRQDIKLAE
jgi:hypothetical protein